MCKAGGVEDLPIAVLINSYHVSTNNAPQFQVFRLTHCDPAGVDVEQELIFW